MTDEYEVTYCADEVIDVSRYIDLLIAELGIENSLHYLVFRNYLYFLEETLDDEKKRKYTFKLDDSHIFYRYSEKRLANSDHPDIRHYIEKESEWKPLKTIDLFSFRNKRFYVYYKEKYIYKIKDQNGKLKIVGDDMFLIDYENSSIKKNMQYIEIETNNQESLNHRKYYLDVFFNKKNKFSIINDTNSKMFLCENYIVPYEFTEIAVNELESLLNRYFMQNYLLTLK